MRHHIFYSRLSVSKSIFYVSFLLFSWRPRSCGGPWATAQFVLRPCLLHVVDEWQWSSGWVDPDSLYFSSQMRRRIGLLVAISVQNIQTTHTPNTYIQGGPKTGPRTHDLSWFCQILTDLQFFFTGRLLSKFAVKCISKIPPHLAYGVRVSYLSGEPITSFKDVLKADSGR